MNWIRACNLVQVRVLKNLEFSNFTKTNFNMLFCDRVPLSSKGNKNSNDSFLLQGFTESVMLLCGLADRRQHQLTHPQQRERIIAAMTTLRKSVPMLSSALQTYAKYPNNAQAKVSDMKSSDPQCSKVMVNLIKRPGSVLNCLYMETCTYKIPWNQSQE